MSVMSTGRRGTEMVRLLFTVIFIMGSSTTEGVLGVFIGSFIWGAFRS